ncbi:MAG: sulfotransferase [Maricaulaceae bacterium]
MESSAPIDPNDAVRTAQTALMEGRAEAALAILAPALAAYPDHIDALYAQAVAQRYTRQFDGAKHTLDQLKAQAPDLGRAHQEDGHRLYDQGDADGAVQAYARATAVNPALEASWRRLAELHERAGRSPQARAATAQAEHIAGWPREVTAAWTLLYDGKPLKAERLIRGFLQSHPKHIDAMRLLAEIGVRLGVLEDAEFVLESAVAFEPNHVQARLDYIQVLRKRQKFEAALSQAQYLYDQNPNHPRFQSQLAIEALQVGDFDRALGLFDQVLAQVPNDPATLTSRGHALKTYGRQDDAVASYRAAIAAKPDHGDAYSSLANLKTYRFTDAELGALKAQEARADLAPSDRIHLSFALGKALEDAGEPDAAFAAFTRGNALKKATSRYNADHMTEELQAQASVCTAELFESRKAVGCPAPDPIFIVGLPRAGSTLIEQILASHPDVDGTLELPHILALSQKLRRRERITAQSAYPQILHTMSEDALRELGEGYIRDTRLHRGEAKFFTDKMPNNFRHIGLIALILPKAKIIDARRHPLACCWSGFKQLFAEGQEFSYSLEDIGRYYRDYVALMDHWDQVLPGRVLRVYHEDVVADLETQVHRLLDFCGLAFDPRCLDFHKTQRSVRTASSEQVREPINAKGLEVWRAYDPHLAPLKKALGPALDRY